MGDLLSPSVLKVLPGSRPPLAAGDHDVRKEGMHTGCGSSPDFKSKINTCDKGQVVKQPSNDGRGGPWAPPETLR